MASAHINVVRVRQLGRLRVDPLIVIVIVKSRFLERPQKRSRRKQLIHRRLTKTNLIGNGQDPESQAGRQSHGYGGWCLELGRGGRYEEDDKSG